jgi:UDPglucose 6-dehydrogenase
LKIVIVGIGYVGLSNAILFAQKHNVICYDIKAEKVNLVNARKSPVKDTEMQKYLERDDIKIHATTSDEALFEKASYVIIATPTDYDSVTNRFNTTSIEQTISNVRKTNKTAVIVIKSTVQVGYTKALKTKRRDERIIFVPEFLREGTALTDNLNPDRVVIGCKSAYGQEFSKLLMECIHRKWINPIFTESSEAEAIKLFANTYLAMRVAFFNELDTFARSHQMSSKVLIKGVCSDTRIGDYYNNPSFGYGGYCLPKDTKQLLENYKDIPQTLIAATVQSNTIRKNFIVDEIIKSKPKTVGIYRLVMKEGSDNLRSSSVLSIMEDLKNEGIEIIIYEPNIKNNYYGDHDIIFDLVEFAYRSDLVLANRVAAELEPYSKKVFTCDLFQRN